MWPKLGEIPFIGLWDVVFTRSLAHCLLWPWPMTFWPNQYVPGPGTPLKEFWWKYILKYLQRYCIHSPCFRSLPTVTLTFDFLISTNPNTYVQKLGELPSLVCEKWCRPPDVNLTLIAFWPNQYVTGPDTYMLSFGEISSNIYEDSVCTQFLGSLPVVTLIFDLWPQKLISTSTNANT